MVSSHSPHRVPFQPPLWLALLAGAAAGGMGWGIRGQYGHETGAMLSGALVGFTLMLLYGAQLRPRTAFVAIAMLTVGIGIGGLETYGQTIGLTQNKGMVGNPAAFFWGELGLFIKGGLWIAIGATFFGSALSGRGWTLKHILSVLGIMMASFLIGQRLLNMPFDPDAHKLPLLNFSADWRWTPDATLDVLKPRQERWGGLLFAWLALMSYRGFVQRDRLAVIFGCAGFVAGGIGFAGGQLWQAGHAWFPDVYKQVFGQVDGMVNWWNIMEITFGSVWGGALSGVMHRYQGEIREDPYSDGKPWSSVWVYVLAGIHVCLLYVWTFCSFPWFDAVADLGIPMTVLPLLLIVVGGVRGAALVALPLTALPIAAKTYVALCVDASRLPRISGFAWLVIIPLVMLTGAISTRQTKAAPLLATGLVVVTLVYYGLNFAFFDFPWPWLAPTGRSHSALLFTIDSVILLTCALWMSGKRKRPEEPLT